MHQVYEITPCFALLFILQKYKSPTTTDNRNMT